MIGTLAGQFFREAIVVMSGLSMGALLTLALKSIRAAVRAADGKRVGHAFLAFARLSSVAVLFLVAQLVYESPEIPPSVKAAVYLVGLTGITVGYFVALITHVINE